MIIYVTALSLNPYFLDINSIHDPTPAITVL